MLSALANDIIFHLDLAQEERSLSVNEMTLRRSLKAKLLGLAAMERSKWRQRSRFTWIRAGDASTKLFLLGANGRRRRNHIPSLVGPSGVTQKHNEKAKILLEHFCNLMGSTVSSDVGMNWDFI